MRKILVLFFLLFAINLSFVASNIDSLENKLNSVDDNSKAFVLNDLAKAYTEISPEKSVLYAKQAIEIALKNNQFDQEARATNSIGIIHYNWGDYDIALENFQKALSIYEKIGDNEGLINTLNNIAAVYTMWKNYDEALNSNLRALKLLEETDNKFKIASAMNNIGVLYQEMGNIANSRIYHQKSLEISKEINDQTSIVNSLNNLGVLSQDENKIEEAIEYYYQAIEIAEKIPNYPNLATFYNNLATVFVDKKEYLKAIPLLDKAYRIASEQKSKMVLQNSYYLYYDVYNATGNCEKALEFYKLHTELKDSIFNIQKSAKIAELQVKYELERNEKEIEILKKENENQELKNGLYKRTRNFLFVTVLLALVLFITNIHRFRNRK